MAEAPPASVEELDALERLIDSWLSAAASASPLSPRSNAAPRTSDAGTCASGARRRRCGRSGSRSASARSTTRRTCCRPPEEDHARFYEHLLRRNRRLTGLKLEIGPEDAVYLAGATPVPQVTAAVLDGILGSMYAATELIFRPAMRIGYASKFRG